MLDIDKLQKAIDDTTPEQWEKLAKDFEARQKAMDDACASGDHQGTLSNPFFSGADIYWQCSRCNRRVLQVGGNLPMTI
jgi:hypothetical protein